MKAPILALALGLSTGAQAYVGIRTIYDFHKYSYRCEPSDASNMQIIQTNRVKRIMNIYYPELHNSQEIALLAPSFPDSVVYEFAASYDDCEAKRKTDFPDRSETKEYKIDN